MIAFFVGAALLLSENSPFYFKEEREEGVYQVGSYLHREDSALKLSHLSYKTPMEISSEEAFLAMMKRLSKGSSYRMHREDPFIAEWHAEGLCHWVRIDSLPREISLLIIAAPEERSAILSPIFQKILEDAKVTNNELSTSKLLL